jgi:hypothetical protein
MMDCIAGGARRLSTTVVAVIVDRIKASVKDVQTAARDAGWLLLDSRRTAKIERRRRWTSG